jgi:hypothetical protein
MADIKVTWTAPADSDLSNVSSILVYRTAETSYTNEAAACTALQALANTSETAGTGTETRANVITTNLTSTVEWTDTGLSAGTYRYGVFSYNNAGANACQSGNGSTSQTVTVT